MTEFQVVDTAGVHLSGAALASVRRAGSLQPIPAEFKPMKNVDMDMRRVWFAWLVAEYVIRRRGGGYRVSERNLRINERRILEDDQLWRDVVLSPGFSGLWPWQAQAEAQAVERSSYLHGENAYASAVSLFWSRLYPVLVETTGG